MVGRSTGICFVALVFMISAINMAEAQSTSIPSCAQELIPCADYLNSSTKPPSSCCDPLKKTVENELTCLCNLFFSDALKNFNIGVDQALKLSRNCGVTSDLTSCKGSAPSPASVPPPATPGNDKGSAGRASFTGLSFLLLFWASMQFN